VSGIESIRQATHERLTAERGHREQRHQHAGTRAGQFKLFRDRRQEGSETPTDEIDREVCGARRSDRSDSHRGCRGCDLNRHARRPASAAGWKRRRRRLLVTTKTLENAIAAPASIGLSRPAAAIGSAAPL
jgi:hypothetical protein